MVQSQKDRRNTVKLQGINELLMVIMLSAVCEGASLYKQTKVLECCLQQVGDLW